MIIGSEQMQRKKQSLSNVEKDLYQWKWAILALHNSLQVFMVMVLEGSNGLNCLKDKVADEWLARNRAGQYEKFDLDNIYIDNKKVRNPLDNYSNLYKKIKKPINMGFYIHTKPFKPSGTQGSSIKKLNSLRNDFVHFLPKIWILEVTGLPQIFLDCVNIIHFLGWECGNIIWCKSSDEKRASEALAEAMKKIKHLSS